MCLFRGFSSRTYVWRSLKRYTRRKWNIKFREEIVPPSLWIVTLFTVVYLYKKKTKKKRKTLSLRLKFFLCKAFIMRLLTHLVWNWTNTSQVQSYWALTRERIEFSLIVWTLPEKWTHFVQDTTRNNRATISQTIRLLYNKTKDSYPANTSPYVILIAQLIMDQKYKILWSPKISILFSTKPVSSFYFS